MTVFYPELYQQKLATSAVDNIIQQIEEFGSPFYLMRKMMELTRTLSLRHLCLLPVQDITDLQVVQVVQ